MIITQTPFRLTLGGGGTDLPSYYSKYGGFILSMAIDKYMYISLNTPLLSDCIQVRYSQNEVCRGPSEVRHTLARAALEFLGIARQIEIVSIADIPAGTGLGSSGCYLIGLLNGLHTLLGRPVGPDQLAEEACHIELDLLRKPVGKQDQYMAAFGGLTTLNIDASGNVQVDVLRVHPETLESLEANTLLFYTGVSRDALDILGQQNREVRRDNAVVVESLHQIKEIGLEIQSALVRGDVHRFGELLDVHWQSKKRLSGGISNPQIDTWYELARKYGAVGGKISGAGGGGFLMVYCDDGKARLREAMSAAGLVELRFRLDYEGSKVLVNCMPTDKCWQHVMRLKEVSARAPEKVDLPVATPEASAAPLGLPAAGANRPHVRP
jgi:D-glycero-alpha-D-manno-heptose-7-phosphate kinase